MANKDEILFYLADGTPVYAADGPSKPDPGRRFGDAPPAAEKPPPPVSTLAIKAFTPGPNDQDQSANWNSVNDPYRSPESSVGLTPFSRQPGAQHETPSNGTAKMMVDYSKNPYATSVPGQPGYDQSKDPFHQTPEQKTKAAEAKKKAAKLRKLYERSPSGEWWTNSRGEKDASNCWGVRINDWEAHKLRLELESMRSRDEALYPGSRARQHSSGGTNLGEPSWSGSGGGVWRQGALEWRMASGAVVGRGGISIVQVIDSWNIYEGQ